MNTDELKRPGRQETFEIYHPNRLRNLIYHIAEVPWKYATAHHADYPHQGQDDVRLYGEDINRWHERKWGMCGYHIIVNPSGVCELSFAGQHLIRGIHVFRNNTDNLGILFFGDFCRQKPTPAQFRTMQEMIPLLKENNIILKTHKDFCYTEGQYKGRNCTACPGTRFPYNLWR